LEAVSVFYPVVFALLSFIPTFLNILIKESIVMLLNTLLSIATLVAVGHAAPMEKRQGPAGVPDFVTKYGTYSPLFLLCQFPESKSHYLQDSKIKEHAAYKIGTRFFRLFNNHHLALNHRLLF
jgi:hypothetical protein